MPVPAELEHRFAVEKELGGFDLAVRDRATGAVARLAVFPDEDMVDGFPLLLERDWFRVQPIGPHVLIAREVGRVDRGSYVVTEWMDAPLLRELVGKQRWSASKVSPVMGSIADGVATFHASAMWGVTVVPERILVGDATVKIDCSLTAWSRRVVRDDRPAASRTNPMYSAYLPYLPYLSPEELTDKGPSSAAADVFALGMIAYELISGRRPWSGVGGELLVAKLKEPPLPLPEDVHAELVSRAPLDRFFSRALAKDPQARIPTVDAFVHEMTQALEQARSR
jgi:serine/threonine-protein kinase